MPKLPRGASPHERSSPLSPGPGAEPALPEAELLIVGAGPAGIATAIAASQAGLRYELLEKGLLVNSIFHFPRNQVFFTTPELLEIGDLPFVTPYEKPRRIEALSYYRRVVDHFGLRVTFGERVRAIRPGAGGFEVESVPVPAGVRSGFASASGPSGPPEPEANAVRAEAVRLLRPRCLVIATGYYDHPNYLGIPGEDLPHVSHYYAEAHAYYAQRVVVVGGKNSAALAALDLWRHGAEVTLVHRRERLSDSVKYWIRPDIDNRLKEGSIASRFEARVVAIEEGRVRLEGPQGSETLPADAVFLLTGYHPDDSLLRGAGVKVDAASGRPDHDPETFESNVPGLFVAGSIVSGRETGRTFIENGRLHGEKIVARVLETRKAS